MVNNLRSTTPELRSDTKVLNRPPVRLRRSAHLSYDAGRESRSRQRTGIGAPAYLPRSSGSRLSPRPCQARFGAVTKRTHGTARCRRCCLPSRIAFAGGPAIQRREPRNLTELQTNRDHALDAVGHTQLPGSIGTDQGHVREYSKPAQDPKHARQCSPAGAVREAFQEPLQTVGTSHDADRVPLDSTLLSV